MKFLEQYNKIASNLCHVGCLLKDSKEDNKTANKSIRKEILYVERQLKELRLEMLKHMKSIPKRKYNKKDITEDEDFFTDTFTF